MTQAGMRLAPPATLLIGNSDWVWPVAIALVVLAALVLSGYWRMSWPSGLRGLAATLKVAGFALLAACLLEPLWSSTRAKPGENRFVLLADNSASLNVQGEPGQTRGDEIRTLLARTEAGWQVRLGQDFDVRRYRMDERITSVHDFGELSFDGAASMVQSALTTLGDRFRGQPLAGILLFTDGNATDLTEEQLARLEGLAPVYPVLPAAGRVPTDLAIGRVSVTQTNFEDAPVTIQADVRMIGTPPAEIVAQLHDEEGTLLQEQRERPPADGSPLAVRFQVKPDEPGLGFFRLRIADAARLDQFDDPARSSEATLANNARVIAVERDRGPYRVLYVCGRPNWEFKFLRRAIADDDQVELIGMIRVARKEAKFDFRGRAGESSNSLFRGFKEAPDEETEAYDQPVVIRLGTKDEAELRDGFPRTKAELYGYHAIVLDDIEAAFFSRDQLTLIERFVAERGGGLLMLGGPESFHQGKYDRTPIADALPVYLDRPPARIDAGWRLNLTRDGWLQPWIRLRTTESDEQSRLGEMPDFLTLNQIRSVKPAAQILSTVRSPEGESLPALVVQPYGAGRAGALLVGDLWRWSLRRAEGQEDDLAKAWRQTIRWLVADVPRRVEISAARTTSGGPGAGGPGAGGEAMQIAVRVRDPEYQPLDNAAAKVVIHAPDGTSIDLDAQPSLAEAGLFEATYIPRLAGAYRAQVQVRDEQGESSTTAETGWASDPAAEEFRDVGVNRSLMEHLARATGGEVIAAADLPDFVETLGARPAPVVEAWTHPLWHSPWMLLAALGCFAGEWGLRRWKGLP